MPTSTQSWRAGVTRYQWLVLFVAWLGWVFDAMDATIYAVVLHPALHARCVEDVEAPIARDLLIHPTQAAPRRVLFPSEHRP